MNKEKSDVLTFLFWANFAAFTVHLLDETLMGGGFVAFIQGHFWSGFAMADFFTANAVWLALIGAGNILYDWLGARAAFAPIFFVWERVLNGLFHLGASFSLRVYSPGLVTSGLFFVLLYLICRYGYLKGHIGRAAFWGGGLAALVFEAAFVSSMWWAH